MATRSARENSTGAARASARSSSDLSSFNPLAAATELPRRQLALMTHSATALFRGSQELRRIQQEAAQRATEHHEEIADRLREPCDFNELLALQADLVRFNLQEATHYWSQVANAALKLQADLVGSAGEALVDGASEPTLESLQRAFEASLNGAATAAPLQ